MKLLSKLKRKKEPPPNVAHLQYFIYWLVYSNLHPATIHMLVARIKSLGTESPVYDSPELAAYAKAIADDILKP